jgi:uncharacterized alpha-E superfamily protein
MMENEDADECVEMFESFAMAQQQQPRSHVSSSRAAPSSTRGVHHVTPDTWLAVNVAWLKKLFQNPMIKLLAKCEICQG